MTTDKEEAKALVKAYRETYEQVPKRLRKKSHCNHPEAKFIGHWNWGNGIRRLICADCRVEVDADSYEEIA